MKIIIRLSMLLLLVCPLLGFHGNRAEFLVDMAEEMLTTGHSDQALEYLGKAIETDPRYVRAYTSRGFFYLQRGRTDLALADFSRLIELNPQDPANYLTRALAYSKIGDKEHAAADFRRGCDLGDTDACTFLKQLQESQ